MARHFFPPDSENAFLKAAKEPFTWGDRALGIWMMYGPIATGAGLTWLVVKLTRPSGWMIGSAFGLTIGLYVLSWTGLFYLFDRAASKAPAPEDRLEVVPFGNVSSRAEGELVMVEGVVKATSQGTVASDLNGKPVLWSSIYLTTYKPSTGRSGEAIDETREREQFVPFTVDDNGTPIEVDAKGGILRAAHHTAKARLNGPGGPRVRLLLDKAELLANHDKAEAYESALYEGDRVVVLGVVKRTGEAYRGGGIVIGSGPHDQLCVSGESRAEMIRHFDGRKKPMPIGLIIGALITAFGLYSLIATALRL